MARMLEWLNRSIRPPDDITPNENDPVSVPPSTVGPDQLVNPGDPHGMVLVGDSNPATPLPRVLPSPWSGWPADWWTPHWSGHVSRLTGTAFACVDKNCNALATMPPYLVGAAHDLDASWLVNPNPEIYTSWEEFAKQLFWDFQGLGEAFVLCTARYATGWPARFHVVPPWMVEVEMVGGTRRYEIGKINHTPDICHIRYTSTVDDAHGHGPLEAGTAWLVAAEVLNRYASNLAANGGIPASVIEFPEELEDDQAELLKAQWVARRMASIGEPAVLSGGIKWTPVQVNAADMALVDLQNFTESRIAVLLGVPPYLVGLPSAGDSLTYANATSLFDYHWRAGLRPMAEIVMSALSGFLLPRGTAVELNRDEYIRPEPLERAQTAEIYNRIQDAEGNPALSVEEIRAAERFTEMTPSVGAIT